MGFIEGQEATKDGKDAASVPEEKEHGEHEDEEVEEKDGDILEDCSRPQSEKAADGLRTLAEELGRILVRGKWGALPQPLPALLEVGDDRSLLFSPHLLEVACCFDPFANECRHHQQRGNNQD